MSIGLIEITFRLSRAEFSNLQIEDVILDIATLEYVDTQNSRTVIFIANDKLTISIKIIGNSGASVGLSLRQLSTERSFATNLVVINNKGAERAFTISDQDFHYLEEVDNSPFDNKIGYGENERSLVKPQKLSNYELTVWYATNRSVAAENSGKLMFKNEQGKLSLGNCKVNIPGNRKVGELNRPVWWRLEFTENLNKHFAILETTQLNEDEFLLGLLMKMKNSSDQDAFIFIHGFNTNFKAGILRTAQLAFDLGFKGAPIFYSWPSFGDVLNYPEDEIAVAESCAHFVSFLKIIEPIIANKKVHIIAHSMGNRLVTAAINALQETPFFQRASFNQLILAAPDVDATEFLDVFAPNLPGTAKRITLYASSADTALKLSRGIHSSVIRLGESGQYITCYDGIDTIDATNTDPTFLGHGYYSNTAQLISDIFQLFKFNFNPEFRNLLPHVSENELYWAFR